MSLQDDFLRFQAQTTPFSAAFEVSQAKGNFIYGKDGKKYLDFVAGISVNTLGHGHPKIISAIKEQLDSYMHVMVYGEYVHRPSLDLCKRLAILTPEPLEVTYLVNSGAEAIEGALKLAKRYTGRKNMVAFKGAYHGNTHGALSVSDAVEQHEAYGPLLPNIERVRFNEIADFNKINENTAAVLVETIQGAAGFVLPEKGYLKALKIHCESVGALLILDEIQPGFGRTGTLFAFEQEDMVPHILVLGKGMGGGLPIGAFMSSREIMQVLSHSPKLGHITTFGGNSVVATAALAMLNALMEEKYMEKIREKEVLFRRLLVHPKIKSIKGKGLMLALELESEEQCLSIAKRCMSQGLIVFWLLYKSNHLRITPPLTITDEEIKKGCAVILEVMST